MMETAMATADWLRAHRGLRVGVLSLTLYRPFPAADVVAALAGVRALVVVERMDNPLAASNPLALEVKAAFHEAATHREGYPAGRPPPLVHTACAGHLLDRRGRRDFVLGIQI